MLTFEALKLTLDGFSLQADFSVRPGQKLAIIGPSGAGKSTFLNGLAGFLEPVSGRIVWQGGDLSGVAPGDRPMSMIFQDNNLFPHLSAFQNVALGVRPSLRLATDETDRVNQALDRVGLAGLTARKPAALSGGQQSRVALARVLARARPLVLLDEPFAALGPALKTEMLDLVAGLIDDTDATLLMVTHDPADALRIADQTIMVADGKAHVPRETASLLSNPPDALRDYLGK